MNGETNAAARCCEEYDEYRRRQLWFRQNRRDFLKTTVGAMAAAPLMPHMLLNSAMTQHLASTPSTAPILVVIQLQGGNDGLNTIVPYSSNLYYGDRPNIAVPAKSVLPIDSQVGFNPNLAAIKRLYDQGKVAVVQGAGYANPSRSHFQGTAIWETANTTGTATTGWLGRYLDAELPNASNPFSAVAVGPMLPMTLFSQRAPVTAIESINSFRFTVERSNARLILTAYEQMYGDTPEHLTPYMNLIRAAGQDAEQGAKDLQAINLNYKPTVQYPTTPLGRDLQLVAQMISANLGTRIFHVTLGGFDDHAAEVYTHARLLQYLSDAVAAFYTDLTNTNRADEVTMMTFSEFGRRVKENAGRGTDHGTAAPMFLIGGKVKGGLYGADPVLGTLDNNGDLIYGVDFRSVYGTVIDKFMGGNSSQILGASYEALPIF